MFSIIEIILSGLLWRLRGIMGWPFTALFALVQAWSLWPLFGEWSLLFALWIIAGEPTGWRPKVIWRGGDWIRCALIAVRIGGIGAVAVPISTWLQDNLDEPPFLNNPREFRLPFWSSTKRLFDWRGAWNEVYFGLIFSAILQLLIFMGGGA